MKLFVTLWTAGLFAAGTSQAQIIGKSVPVFTTAAGTVVHVGDTLHVGRGSQPTGGFEYIYVPANMFTGSHEVKFTSRLNGLSLQVKDVRVQHDRTYGDKTVAVIKTDHLNGCVDLNAAEAAGEIVTVNTRRAAVSAAGGAAAAAPSTADELLKLKQLYDQKILTKPEYEAQKAKLLK